MEEDAPVPAAGTEEAFEVVGLGANAAGDDDDRDASLKLNPQPPSKSSKSKNRIRKKKKKRRRSSSSGKAPPAGVAEEEEEAAAEAGGGETREEGNGVKQEVRKSEWKSVDARDIGVAGGTWNVVHKRYQDSRSSSSTSTKHGKQSEGGRGSAASSNSSGSTSYCFGLPKVDPIVVSYEGLGAFLVTSSGPLLRVHKLQDGKLINSSRAHRGVIVALVPVPAQVNRLQAMTLAKCLTIVVWDVARAAPLARVHVNNLIELHPNQKHVPLGLSLGVATKKEVSYAVGWLCMRTENEINGNKTSAVRSFQLQLRDLLKMSRGGGGDWIDYDNNSGRSSKHKPKYVLSKSAGRKLRSAYPQMLRSSYSGGLIAAADQQSIFLWKSTMKPEEGVTLHHTKTVTSLAVCTGDDQLAVGDSVGQILIYKLDENRLWSAATREERSSSHQPATFHWHSNAVLCLEWGVKDEEGLAPEIMHLYSGGSECTLIIWEFPQGKKSFLPRFPAPLLSLRGCHSQKEELGMESLLAVGCADNSVVVINVVTKSKLCTISGLQVPYDKVLSLQRNHAGRAEVSLFKSKRGILQKYDLDQDCQISQLSVSYNHDQTPYVNSSSKKASAQNQGGVRTLVSYCANQKYLCTVEQHAEGMNIWLKFWTLTPSKTYEVEKTILNPHDKQVKCLVGHNEVSLVATCSRDGKFKLWTRVQNEWICSCQTSVPCSYINTSAFSGSGDVFAASFGENVGFWDTNDLTLMATLKCPPSLMVKKFDHIALISESKPAYLVGIWVSRKRCKGVSVWNLLTLRHLWSLKFDGNCHVSCASTGTSGSQGKFAISIASNVASEDDIHNTKVMFFDPKSSNPEKVWHVSAYATDLLSMGEKVVIATKEGNFISQDFATKVKEVVQVSRDKNAGERLSWTPSAMKSQEEHDQQGENVKDSTRDELERDFVSSVPNMLSKYQNVPSHVLPSLTTMFEQLLKS